jgi:hypothetical protein
MNLIDIIPFENKVFNVFSKKLLAGLLIIPYRHFNWNFSVETEDGELLLVDYINNFTNNLIESLIGCKRYRKGTFCYQRDMPNRVYHGTSTSLYPLIMKYGLLPSKFGLCWKEDREKKVPKVCLTDSLYAAEYFAYNASEEIGGDPIVLKINIEDIKEHLNIRLENFVNGCSTPLDVYKEFYSRASIASSLMVGWYLVPKKSVARILRELICMINEIH